MTDYVMVRPDGYKKIRKIDGGSQANVKLCEDPNGQLVAVKTYYNYDYHDFLREVFGLQLNGLLIDKIVQGNAYHIIMKLGDYTAEELATKNPSDELLLVFFQDVIQQLDVLKRHGIIHCDIKLNNVIYTKEPIQGRHFHLIDFGLFEFSNSYSRFKKRYTAYCRSPDLCEVKRRPEYRDELWALGMSLLSMVCTMHPSICEDFPLLEKAFTYSWKDDEYAQLRAFQYSVLPNTFVEYGVSPLISRLIYKTVADRVPSTTEFMSEFSIKTPEIPSFGNFDKTFGIATVKAEFSKSKVPDKFLAYSMVMAIDVAQKTGVSPDEVTEFVTTFIYSGNVENYKLLIFTEGSEQLSMALFDSICTDSWYNRMRQHAINNGRLTTSEFGFYQKMMNDPKFHQLSIEEQLEVINHQVEI